VLTGSTPEETVAYWREIAALERSVNGAVATIAATFERIGNLEQALDLSLGSPDTMDTELDEIKQELYDIESLLSGNQSKAEVGGLGPHTILNRLQVAGFGTAYSTYGPTTTQRRSFEIASEEYAGVRDRLNTLTTTRIPELPGHQGALCLSD